MKCSFIFGVKPVYFLLIFEKKHNIIISKWAWTTKGEIVESTHNNVDTLIPQQ